MPSSLDLVGENPSTFTTPAASATPMYILSSSDEDDSDSPSWDEQEEESHQTLGSIKKSLKRNLNVRSNYTKWGPVAAFREIVQNWRDAIIRSFSLAEAQFTVIRETDCTKRNIDIVYKVPNPRATPPECLGYIRFFGTDKAGSIEVVNRNSTLEPWHLDIGGTSKAGNYNQAGAHGEGLKIALLVLQRGDQNHSVKCFTGSFTLNFNFDKTGKLLAHFRRMTQDQVSKADIKSQKQEDKSLAPFAVSVRNDVQFLIGRRVAGRDESGNSTRRVPVSLGNFNKWCESALFLQDVAENEGIIRTKRGDLIIDSRLRGNIYLKGLLLNESSVCGSASITGKPLKFGYNFLDGITNRERQSITQPTEECRAILQIWEQILVKKPEYVSHLNDMLLSTKPEYAEVWNAKSVIKIDLAVKLKDYLLSKTNVWYYSVTERSQNALLDKIIQGLEREGVELPNAYWSILAKHHLIQTAKEKQQELFLDSEVIAVLPTHFAKEASRLIRACMQSCLHTSNMIIHYIKAGHLSLNTFHLSDKNIFKIHERWLCNEQVIQELGLPTNLAEVNVLFHGTKRLFADILDEIPIDRFDKDDHHSNTWHKKQQLSLAEQRVLEYTQMKKSLLLKQCTHQDSSLCLEWNGNLSLSDDIMLTIQLHHESCHAPLHNHLIARDIDTPPVSCIARDAGSPPTSIDLTHDEADQTQCFEILCKPGLGEWKFSGLKPGTEYFALMFQPSDPDSIVLFSDLCTVHERPTLPRRGSPKNKALDERRDPMETPSRRSRPHSAQSNPLPSNVNAQRSRPPVPGGASNEAAAKMSQRHDNHPNFSRASSFEGNDSPAGLQNSNMPVEQGMVRTSCTPGALLDSLDILEPRDWYAGTNASGTKVVIGISKGESQNNETGRKRQRMDE